jgi:parvulin-like peptidyl-prolyl isomerase
MKNEKVKAQYLFFDPKQVSGDNIAVTDEMIEKYYKDHQKEYLQPEMRQVQYIKFELKPSKEDTLQTLETAQFIIEEIQAGSDFEELARDFSKDPGSAAKGGDLGFIGKGTMVKPFEEAVFSAKPGSLIGPVETQFGLHIIEVLARKREKGETQVHARHILLKHEISSETYDDIQLDARSFYNELTENKKITFASLAEQKKYTVSESPLFREAGFIPGIGMSNLISRRAFKNEIGWISEPVRSGDNLFIFRISKIQKAGVKPLEEIKTTITRNLERQKQIQMAEKQASEIWNTIKSGTDFEKAARQAGLDIQETDFFSLQSPLPQIGQDPKFSGTAFSLEKEAVSPPVEGNRGYYLIKLIDRKEVTTSLFESDKENLKKQLLGQKQQQMYAAWEKQLREKADIEDYREDYFY